MAQRVNQIILSWYFPKPEKRIHQINNFVYILHNIVTLLAWTTIGASFSSDVELRLTVDLRRYLLGVLRVDRLTCVNTHESVPSPAYTM